MLSATRFLLRTTLMFLGGAGVMLVVVFMFVIAMGMIAMGFGCGLLLAWSFVTYALYAVSHDPRMLHDATQALLSASVGFGLVVVTFSMAWDTFKAARNRLRRPVYALSFANS